MDKFFRMAAVLFAAITLAGCGGSVEQWIVDTRVHQGESALLRGNSQDAAQAFRLALRVNPQDARAQSGFVQAASGVANLQYQKGDFEGALATIAEAQKVDPQSVHLQALKSDIDTAKLDREIVISNYPIYKSKLDEVQHGFSLLPASNKTVLSDLKRFNYTFNSQDLTKATKDAYRLEDEVSSNIRSLLLYRQNVETGAKTQGKATSGSGGSLLPLP